VLLFASSIIAGWVENWFVLHRLDSAILQPAHHRLLGGAAPRAGRFLRGTSRAWRPTSRWASCWG
jgi:site-specific recombinase